MIKEKIANNPLVYLFSKKWKYSKDNRRNIYLYWTLFIVGNISTLFLEPFLTAKMMNVIQVEGITASSIKTLFQLLGCFVLATIFFWACHAPARVVELVNAFKVRMNYRHHFIKGVFGLPLEWHNDHHTGDTIDKIEKGTTGLYNFAEDTFLVIYAIVELIISLGMLVYFSHSAGFIVIGMLCVSAWITMSFDRILIKRHKELSGIENKIAERVIDSISNISTLIILRVERIVFRSIMHMVEKPYEFDRKTNILSETKWALTGLCCRLTTVLVLGFFFWDTVKANGTVLIGSVFLLTSYLNRIEETFFRFTGMYGDIIKRRARVSNAEELSKDFIPDAMVNHVMPNNWHELQIKDLEFSYQTDGEGSSPHIDGVNLTIRKGERIAFVGKSGSGKTTCLKLMRDLYHPTKLELFLDGTVIPNGFEGIAQAVTLIPQDPEIFASTIEMNCTLGAEYTLDEIQQCMDLAGFTEVLKKLPKGIQSSTKEKGVSLSGGQKQRLALARGLLACKDKQIVLLDEQTSNLDKETESLVYRNIFKKFTGQTIIASLHGIHLLPLFDRVIMFHDGKVIADGTLDELLESSEEFRHLWSKQYHKE